MAKDTAEVTKDSALQTPDVEAKKKDVDKKKDPKGKDGKKLNVFKRVGRFFKDAKSEFKKIVWPSKKQVLNNTIVVLVVMVIVGIAVWLLDYLFINGFNWLFH